MLYISMFILLTYNQTWLLLQYCSLIKIGHSCVLRFLRLCFKHSCVLRTPINSWSLMLPYQTSYPTDVLEKQSPGIVNAQIIHRLELFSQQFDMIFTLGVCFPTGPALLSLVVTHRNITLSYLPSVSLQDTFLCLKLLSQCSH